MPIVSQCRRISLGNVIFSCVQSALEATFGCLYPVLSSAPHIGCICCVHYTLTPYKFIRVRASLRVASMTEGDRLLSLYITAKSGDPPIAPHQILYHGKVCRVRARKSPQDVARSLAAVTLTNSPFGGMLGQRPVSQGAVPVSVIVVDTPHRQNGPGATNDPKPRSSRRPTRNWSLKHPIYAICVGLPAAISRSSMRRWYGQWSRARTLNTELRSARRACVMGRNRAIHPRTRVTYWREIPGSTNFSTD